MSVVIQTDFLHQLKNLGDIDSRLTADGWHHAKSEEISQQPQEPDISTASHHSISQQVISLPLIACANLVISSYCNNASMISTSKLVYLSENSPIITHVCRNSGSTTSLLGLPFLLHLGTR